MGYLLVQSDEGETAVLLLRYTFFFSIKVGTAHARYIVGKKKNKNVVPGT